MSVRYVAFLRGINLGKRRATKEQLAEAFEGLGFERVKTLIASGNVVFSAEKTDEAALTEQIEDGLQAALGFTVDTMLRTSAIVDELIDSEPFAGIDVTKQTRRYVTLLAAKTASSLHLPHEVMDGALRILSRTDREVFSVLDLGKSGGTVDAMRIIEQEYGKAATTRNWNTILKLRGL
ncbi:MAG: DUF1697 domain-containing protein [Chloroflexota bacterium]